MTEAQADAKRRACCEKALGRLRLAAEGSANTPLFVLLTSSSLCHGRRDFRPTVGCVESRGNPAARFNETTHNRKPLQFSKVPAEH